MPEQSKVGAFKVLLPVIYVITRIENFHEFFQKYSTKGKILIKFSYNVGVFVRCPHQIE